MQKPLNPPEWDFICKISCLSVKNEFSTNQHKDKIDCKWHQNYSDCWKKLSKKSFLVMKRASSGQKPKGDKQKW